MFKQQEIILKAAPGLTATLEKYQWESSPKNWLELAEAKSQNFSVILPFVGAFSAGKSTLLNALIGTPLFPTNIDPETAFPAELFYEPDERIIGAVDNGKKIPLSRDDLKHNLPSLLPKDGYVSVALPHPLLARLPHLRLVDMPGWDSGIATHTAAIDNYAARSLAYCVVVSAEEGNLRESLRRALRELAVHKMPIIVVISKSDKKPSEDVDAVAEQVHSEVVAVTGQQPFATVKVSARKNQFDELIDALVRLEHNAEALFARNVTQTVVPKLVSFSAHLDTLINSDDLDSEKIQAQCDQLNADMATFATRLDDETRQLETRVQPVLGRIMDRIGTALREDMDSLVSDAMYGGDLSGSIGTTVRLAAQEGIANEFNPEIERYLNRAIEGLPADFSPEINYAFDNGHDDRDSDSPSLTITPTLTTILLPLLKLIPKLNVISTVILGVVGLLESLFANKQKQQADEARQRESVRREITGTVIPDVLRQVRAALQPILQEHIQSAKQKIADTVKAQQTSHIAALQQLQAKLAEGQTAFAAARAQYQADRDNVTQLITSLESAQ